MVAFVARQHCKKLYRGEALISICPRLDQSGLDLLGKFLEVSVSNARVPNLFYSVAPRNNGIIIICKNLILIENLVYTVTCHILVLCLQT